METLELLASRRDSHGDYGTKAKFIQKLKKMIRKSYANERNLLSETHLESLDNIAQKMGRILYGNPDFIDHWDDIAGYAKLSSEAIKEQEIEDYFKPCEDQLKWEQEQEQLVDPEVVKAFEERDYETTKASG